MMVTDDRITFDNCSRKRCKYSNKKLNNHPRRDKYTVKIADSLVRDIAIKHGNEIGAVKRKSS